MADYRIPVTISIRRTAANVIEYTLTFHNPISGDHESTFHANREATFHGPHTGNPGRQIHGGASTLWRADDTELLLGFQRKYRPVREISIQ